MQAAEIFDIASTFVRQGVTKIRLTGGEPLVRKDLDRIILSLSRLPVNLTLTTNGVRAKDFIPLFRQGNIRSINVSLDTLKRERFTTITRRDLFDTVYENIGALIREKIHVKVNVVVMKDLNDDEVNDFVEWTKHEPVHVRFIEFMPFQGNRWTSNKVLTWQQILQKVEDTYSMLPLKGAKNDTAKSYVVPGHKGTFSVISTMSAPFCSTCNRMRLTADGKLKNCLFSRDEFDILGPLRRGEDIVPIIHHAIGLKEKETGGQLSEHFEMLRAESIENRSMIRIGG
jgi:cyclic pyranopterin phosphate synthase